MVGAHPLRRCPGGDPFLVGRASGYRGSGDSSVWTRLCRHAHSAANPASKSRTGTGQAGRPARLTPTARLIHYRTKMPLERHPRVRISGVSRAALSFGSPLRKIASDVLTT